MTPRAGGPAATRGVTTSGRPRWPTSASGTCGPRPAGAYPDGAAPCGARQLIGDVWEWTSSDFLPYPGFTAWPYKEYSQVFFGPEYKVLRGGAFGVSPVACRGTFRNWDYPIRRQIFAGFRTARSDGAPVRRAAAGRPDVPSPGLPGAACLAAVAAHRPAALAVPAGVGARRQRHGTVNADGFGIGWYAGSDPVPARYRRGEPIWGDPSLPDLARVTSSGAVLAAVRSATPGTASGPEAAARRSAAAPGCSATTARRSGGGSGGSGVPVCGGRGVTWLLSCLEAMSDAALLWALTGQRLRAGLALDAALAGTVAAVEAAGGTGRLNLLLTDGRSVAATAYGDTLWYRQRGRPGAASVTVASEPDDDGPGWTEVPDRHVLTATPSQVRVRPLAISTFTSCRHRRPTTPIDHVPATTSTHDSKGSPPHDHHREPVAGRLPGRFAAGRRAGRPHRHAEVAAAQVVLRRAGQRAVREDHRAARVLPDPGGAVHPAGRRPPDRGAHRGGLPGRARLGLVGQDAAAALRAARRGHAAPVRAGRRERVARSPWPGTPSRPSTRAWRCTRSWPTSSSTWACRRPPATVPTLDPRRWRSGRAARTGRGSWRSSGPPSATWSPPSARSSCAGSGPGCARATPSCSAPTWSRTRPCSSPPTTTTPG